jgi:HEPN domain-containing protein
LYLRKGLQEHAVRSENFFFFVQQTLEKLLKAVLISQQLPVPLVHDLGILIAKIPREIEPPFGYEINRLSEFAAIRRYEESSLIWNEEEADEAIELGQKFHRFFTLSSFAGLEAGHNTARRCTTNHDEKALKTKKTPQGKGG